MRHEDGATCLPVHPRIDEAATNDGVGIDDVALRARIAALLAQGDVDPLIATELPVSLKIPKGNRPEPTPLTSRVDAGRADGLVMLGMRCRIGLDGDEDVLAPEPRGV